MWSPGGALVDLRWRAPGAGTCRRHGQHRTESKRHGRLATPGSEEVWCPRSECGPAGHGLNITSRGRTQAKLGPTLAAATCILGYSSENLRADIGVIDIDAGRSDSAGVCHAANESVAEMSSPCVASISGVIHGREVGWGPSHCRHPATLPDRRLAGYPLHSTRPCRCGLIWPALGATAGPEGHSADPDMSQGMAGVVLMTRTARCWSGCFPCRCG
jgi:hypothetical protein